MPRLLKYLGPFDTFDTGSMFDKRYQFVSPGEHRINAFDRVWAPGERGQAVAVNNDHADGILTRPWQKEHHRFVEVSEQTATPSAAVAATPPTADKPALAPTK